MKTQTFYYSDEVNDELSQISRREIKIDENFKFVHHNVIWRILAFIVYHFFVFPFAYLWMKIRYHQKTIGKKKLKLVKDHRYFIYGNHTQAPGDGFLPSLMLSPVKPYVVVNKDNLALKGTKNIMQMLGAIPIPTDLHAMPKFQSALKYWIARNHPIVIYPEAHIWPYYTKIRDFKPVSFKYPIKMELPVFCFTNVYTKKRGILPKMTTYIDGPFYPNQELKGKEKIIELRNRVYNQMVERSKLSTYSVNTFIRKKD